MRLKFGVLKQTLLAPQGALTLERSPDDPLLRRGVMGVSNGVGVILVTVEAGMTLVAAGTEIDLVGAGAEMTLVTVLLTAGWA